MILILDKSVSAKKAKEKINQLQKKRQFDAYQFLGKIKKWGESGVEYQRKMRDEWDKDFFFSYDKDFESIKEMDIVVIK